MSINTYTDLPCDTVSSITIDTEKNTVETIYAAAPEHGLVYNVADSAGFEELLLEESKKEDFRLLSFVTSFVRSGELQLVLPQEVISEDEEEKTRLMDLLVSLDSEEEESAKLDVIASLEALNKTTD